MASMSAALARPQINELLASLDDNHMGWSARWRPSIMGNPDRPELGEELTNSFCRTDPEIAKQFARVTFMSDNRADLPTVSRRAPSSCNAKTTSSPPKALANYVHSKCQIASRYPRRLGPLPQPERAPGGDRRNSQLRLR